MSENITAPCQFILIFSIKVSSKFIKSNVNPVSKENDNHPLLDWIIPTDFSALGIAFAINERGNSSSKYRTKKDIKEPYELYCKPSILNTINSKKIIPSKIISTIDKQITIVFILFILNTSSIFRW